MTIRAAGRQKYFAALNEEAVAVMQQTAIAGVETALQEGSCNKDPFLCLKVGFASWNSDQIMSIARQAASSDSRPDSGRYQRFSATGSVGFWMYEKPSRATQRTN